MGGISSCRGVSLESHSEVHRTKAADVEGQRCHCRKKIRARNLKQVGEDYSQDSPQMMHGFSARTLIIITVFNVFQAVALRPLVHGKLQGPGALSLTSRFAVRLFGDTEPIVGFLFHKARWKKNKILTSYLETSMRYRKLNPPFHWATHALYH